MTAIVYIAAMGAICVSTVKMCLYNYECVSRCRAEIERMGEAKFAARSALPLFLTVSISLLLIASRSLAAALCLAVVAAVWHYFVKSYADKTRRRLNAFKRILYYESQEFGEATIS